jgi:transporter family-2 protein
VPRTTLALGAAVLSGVLVAVQARINAGLAEDVGDALLAALVSFATGLVTVAALVLTRAGARRASRAVRGMPWWTRLGGVGGATLVTLGAYVAPRIGVALLTVGLVAGQTTGGLIVDRAGIGPGGRHPSTPSRIVGAVLCLVAVGISVLGKGAGNANPLLLALVVAGGFSIAFQQGVNGRIRERTGDAGVATLVNFVVGTALLIVAYLGLGAVAGWHVDHWPGLDRWWLYSGGPLGATFVAVAAAIVPSVGVLRFGLAVVAGQLIGAILLDIVVPAADVGIAAATLAGAALTLVAVAVSGRPARTAAA